MAGYITYSELIDNIDADKVVGKSQTSLQLLIDGGRDLIDAYCKQSFSDTIPSIVKVVNIELVSFMLQDVTVESVTEGKRSVKNNLKAYLHILVKLENYISTDPDISTRKKARASLI